MQSYLTACIHDHGEEAILRLNTEVPFSAARAYLADNGETMDGFSSWCDIMGMSPIREGDTAIWVDLKTLLSFTHSCCTVK